MALMRKRELVGSMAATLAVVLAGAASALDGGSKAPHGHFGVVGSFAPTRSALGSGFSGVQIAPRWVLTAAHVAPAVGAIFVNDYGMSGVAEVLTFPLKVPTQTPLVGALRDDLALVRLAVPIASPYFPRLADDVSLPGPGSLSAKAYSGFQTTLVSNNPSIGARRFGSARFEGLFRAPGYDFLLVVGDSVALVGGDSGSPAFLGRLNDADGESVVAGVATGQSKATNGAALGIYTRAGPYRRLLDAAVEASGERVRWYAARPEAAHQDRNERP